jgi:hypothetical protein
VSPRASRQAYSACAHTFKKPNHNDQLAHPRQRVDHMGVMGDGVVGRQRGHVRENAGEEHVAVVPGRRAGLFLRGEGLPEGVDESAVARLVVAESRDFLGGQRLAGDERGLQLGVRPHRLPPRRMVLRVIENDGGRPGGGPAVRRR